MSLNHSAEKPASQSQQAMAILTDFIEQHLPALGLIGARVVNATLDEVLIEAPLKKNFNDKGSAFGGSQYLLCIGASWGLAYLNALDEGIAQPDLIGAEGNIKYLKPVYSEKILARAQASPEEMARFRQSVRNKQKARLAQQSIIEDADTGKASEFQITYVMFPVQPSTSE